MRFFYNHIPYLCIILYLYLYLLTVTGEEIVSGAQRIHDVALLTERAEHWKVREKFQNSKILITDSSLT